MLKFSIVIAILFAPTSLMAQERMREGLWEQRMVGMAAPGVESTTTRCMRPDELSGQNGTADDIRAAMQVAAPSCTLGEVTAEGDHVTWRQNCGVLHQTGDFHYRGTTMDGAIKMWQTDRPAKTITIQGKRLGPCPPM